MDFQEAIQKTKEEWETNPQLKKDRDEVIPLSVIAQDVSTTGIYNTETTSWYDEETGEIGEELVYFVDCNLNFEGYISEDATFYDSVSINSISIENDGTYELSSFMSPDNLYQAGLGGLPGEGKEPETPQEPSDDNYLWQVEKNARTDVDVKELSEERKAKVKMIALAELEEQRKKDPVQSAVNEALERLKKEKEVKSWDV